MDYKNMDKIKLFAACILIPFLFSDCSPKKSAETEPVKKDRNLFGHNIPRGLTINTEGLKPGYVMFSVPNSASTYLINRNGKVVHEWKGNYGAFNPYLMDDGAIVQGVNDPDYPVFGFGGPYGRIQKVTWESKMLWDFEYADEEQIVHHDFAVLPNGNILAIAYETWTYEDAIAHGRIPEMTPKTGPWLEKIIEIEPQGERGAEIVWEWHVSDHLVQDYDDSKANFGNPSELSELLDFNLGEPIPPAITPDSLETLKSLGMAERNQTPYNKGSDIFHFNAINYNENLDQIVISSPYLNEIFIIDHSTSVAEAASHHGGRSGKGGDFLYRWGNPENYHQGDSIDRQLFGQHDVRWVEKGKPGGGNLTVFNNHAPSDIDWSTMGNLGNNYSMVLEIETPVDENGIYDKKSKQAFSPKKPTWFYMAADTLSFYSSFISGAHRMNNGNTFINEGARGRFLEVSPEGTIVWEYLVPYRGTIHKPNGDPVSPMFMTFSTFRSTFVPADHPALLGKELKPLDPQPSEFVMPPSPK